jgi:hypothetical protein
MTKFIRLLLLTSIPLLQAAPKTAIPPPSSQASNTTIRVPSPQLSSTPSITVPSPESASTGMPCPQDCSIIEMYYCLYPSSPPAFHTYNFQTQWCYDEDERWWTGFWTYLCDYPYSTGYCL